MREKQIPREEKVVEIPTIPQLPSEMEVIEKNGWFYAVLPNGKLVQLATM